MKFKPEKKASIDLDNIFSRNIFEFMRKLF